jgi:hypothetical protein
MRWRGRCQFFEREGKLFFVEDTRFCEIQLDDIREGREGWRSTRPPKPEPPRFEDGPPASPLSWESIQSPEKLAAARFTPRQSVSKLVVQPTSVELVDFRDARPYGEVAHREAWLARYDSVLVGPDSAHPAYLSLYAAYDVATGDLVCAFTPSAPRWTRSIKGGSVDPETRLKRDRGSDLSPAACDDLRSTPAEVLASQFVRRSRDPYTAGQIILRPRFEKTPFGYKRFEGKLLPINPPSNVWIVEILGTPADPEYGYANYVAELRDEALDNGLGMPCP